jgi:UDPglucose--hexose-1-phosphate uridylyltransferase
MQTWRERMRAHAGAAYLHLTVDEGGAGPSGAWLHALPFVPAQVARERERFSAYHQRTQGRNLLADLLQEEVRRRERVVAVGPGAVAICPFASHGPYHVQILPRAERMRFEDEGHTGADTLHEVLERLAAVLGGLPPLNLWVRTAPPGSTAFCWRIDVVPHTDAPGGLEMGAGVQLSALAPERAAESLRGALR